MYSFESIDLSEYRGDDYFLVGFVEPKPPEGEDYDPDEDAENYGVVVVQEGAHPLEENDQIVRMDTRHGRPHMDKEYLPADTDKERKEWLEEGYTYERMKAYLLSNWKIFADRHIYYNE